MGLRVEVFRGSFHDRLARFADVTEVTVVNADGPFEPSESAPAARLDVNAFGQPIVVPVDQPKELLGPMFSGSFAYTSDSRWSEATRMYGAVPIHDRFETQQQYDALSD